MTEQEAKEAEAAIEEAAEAITPQKKVRYVDTRSNAVDLDVQLAKEKAEELAPEMKDTDTNKERIKKSKNPKQSQKKNQPANKMEAPKPKPEKKEKLHVVIGDTITVGDLAQKLKVAATEVIKRLMQLGIMAAMNQEVEYDVAALIAEDMGAEVTREEPGTVLLDCTNVTKIDPNPELVRKMRASYYLMGALLSRFHKAHVALPGGCNFASRPIDQHIKGFRALGAEVEETEEYVALTPG